MEVVSKFFDVYCNLWEYAGLHMSAQVRQERASNISDCLSDFLHSTIVACCGERDKLIATGHFTLEKHACMEDMITSVLQKIFTSRKLKKKDDNVLARGFWLNQDVSPTMGGLNGCNYRNSQICWSNNSMVQYVQGEMFEQLHVFLGSDLMAHLLVNLSVFIREGDTFIQVCGQSIHNRKPAFSQHHGQTGKLTQLR